MLFSVAYTDLNIGDPAQHNMYDVRNPFLAMLAAIGDEDEAEQPPPAHCNYFGPYTPGKEGLPAYFRFLLSDLKYLLFEDTYVFCDIKQAKSPFIYKMQSLIFK